MADKIDFKIGLTPDFENVKKQAQELKTIIDHIDNSKIKDQFTNLEQKILAITELFKKENFGREAIQSTGKAIQSAFGDIQKIGQELGHLDFSQVLEKSQKELEDTEKKLDSLTKKLGAIDNKKTRTQNNIIKNAGIKRSIGSGNQKEGTNISSYSAAEKHLKVLEAANKQNTTEYKNLVAVMAKANVEADKLTEEAKKYQVDIEKTKNQYDQIVKKINTLATKEGKLTQAQSVGQKAFTQASVGKVSSIENTNKMTAQWDKEQENKNVNLDIKGPTTEIENLNKAGQKNSTVFGNAVRNLTSYTLILGSIKRAGRSAKQTIEALDKALTEQAMVAGKNKEEMVGLLAQYQKLAQKTGATTKEVAGVATEYFRQGKSAQEALILTEAAVSAAKVGAISTSESVDYLTTAINGFQMAAEDAMAVSDRFAALAASSATNYEELAVALSKCASQANLAGMSMDYTLGLLAKGIETTREAPETIGTALKTIIARMREMTDYGKTLEDGVDINNLETQLGYVGIALRNQQGELRSTEAVLDEIGRSWDTFGANQQAALAKALAGTRQQSRLISIMQNYDRTLELVDISQTSAGATAGQMAVYMTSMEAAVNEVSVAWETFVTNLLDSELIIDIVQQFADILTNIANFANTDFGLVTIFTGLALVLTSIIGMQLQQKAIAREQLLTQRESYANDLKKQRMAALEKLTKSENAAIAKKANKLQEIEVKLLSIKAKKELLIQQIKAGDKSAGQKLIKLEAEENKLVEQRIKAEAALDKELEKQKNTKDEAAQSYLKANQDVIDSQKNSIALLTQSSGLLYVGIGLVKTIVTMSKSLVGFVKMANVARKAENAGLLKTIFLLKRKALAEKIAAAFGMANSAAAIPIAGWVIAAGILITLLGLSLGIAAAAGGFESQEQKKEKSMAKTTSAINNLNAEMGKLNKTIQATLKVDDAWEKFNSHIVKTEEDTKNLNEALKAARETLTEDEQKQFDAFGDDQEGQVAYLDNLKQEKEEMIKYQQAMQIAVIQNSEYTADLLKTAEVKAALHGMVADAIYREIDPMDDLNDAEKRALKKSANATQQELDEEEIYNRVTANTDNADLSYAGFGKAWRNAFAGTDRWGLVHEFNAARHALKEGDFSKALSIIDDDERAKAIFKEIGLTDYDTNLEQIAKGITQTEQEYGLKKMSVIRTGKDGEKISVDKSYIDILNDPDASLKEQKIAYEHLKTGYEQSTYFTSEADRQSAMNAFNTRFSSLAEYLSQLGDPKSSLFTYISDKGITGNNITDFQDDLKNIGFDQTQFDIFKFLGLLQDNKGSYTDALKSMGINLEDLSDEKKNGLIASITRFSTSHSGTSQTTMQNSTKSKSKISAIYQKQRDYLQGKLRGDEFASYIADNGWFFDDPDAYNAFVSGQDLSSILIKDGLVQAEAERNKTALKNAYELAVLEHGENSAQAKNAKAELDSWTNYQTLMLQPLEDRIKAEEALLKRRKELYQKEKDEEIKLLEEKKKAYQEYFDAIEEQESFEAYEEKRTNLIANISSLGASTSGDANIKRLEYETQLEELEKERVKELKDNAKDKLIENIDNTIESINNKFDKLLEDDNTLISNLQGEGNKEARAQLFKDSISDIWNNKNLTDLRKQEQLNNLINDFLPYMGTTELQDIVKTDEQGNVTLQIGGDTINLGSKSDNDNIWLPILAKLTELGIIGMSGQTGE